MLFLSFLELKIYVKSAIHVDSKSENCDHMEESVSINSASDYKSACPAHIRQDV